MKKITYIFGPGRVSKLKKDTEYAKDFFTAFIMFLKIKTLKHKLLR